MRSQKNGFSLLELSVVLLAISLLLASAFAVATANARAAKQRELNDKMEKIEKILFAYVRQNGKLPCPAPPTVSTPVPPVYISLSCTSATWSTSYRAQYTATQPDGTSSYVVIGTLPTTTLGITDELATDPWGNQFTFAVDSVGAASVSTYVGALDYYPPSYNMGVITIRDGANNTLASNAIAVLISHGPNGNGAWPFQMPYSAASSYYTSRPGASDSTTGDTDELQNCHCPVTGVRAANPADATFVQKPYGKSAASNTDTFDDTVRYWRRGDFISPANIATENQ